MARTRFLPMFPLKLVVFPNEKLNLHIFEPRYKQLIMECEADGKTFGIPAFINNKMMDIGTEMRLIAIEKRHAKGEMDIRTEAIGLFKIIDFYNQAIGKMYGAADIETLKIVETKGDFLTNEAILTQVAELFQLLSVNKELPTDIANFETYDVAHYVGFSVEQEYDFLCVRTELERQNFMQKHLNAVLPVVREMEYLRQRALLNGHFKNIIPPKF